MLINLHIENFLIIEKTSIDFGEGLNVITGETGSGKSMIFDAIGLILGDKGGKDLIRNQSEKAFLQATFMIDDPRIHRALENEGFAPEDTLIISRDLYSSGKSLYKVNGRLVTSQFVRQLGQYLINLSGQHENQILLDANHHRQMIDEYGQTEIMPLIKEIEASYHAYKEVEASLSAYDMTESEWLKEVDFLSYQIEEIRQAKLKPDEEEGLESRYTALKHFESVQSAVSSALGQCKEERGILSQLNRIKRNLQEVLKYNADLNEPFNQLESAYYSVEAASDDLRNMLDNMAFDEGELEALESRMSLLHDLKRKFGRSIAEIHSHMETLEARHAELLNYDARKLALENEKAAIANAYKSQAAALSEVRRAVAKDFEVELVKELQDLNFNQCHFFCEFHQLEGITPQGTDKIEFHLSTNPGEPPRPLRKIASGGELSRIMLAVKLVNRKGDYATTQIFDEIDSGISGRTANAVAQKLKTISREGQVILVTHLPQIAIQGDQHLLIDKVVDGHQTKVQINTMRFEDRITEIARMIGSGEITELTKMSAKEMLLNASN